MTFRNSLYRPSREALTSLPLGARSVGHYRVEPSYVETPFRKHFVQVFWSVAGCGALGRRELPPGWLAVYLPGDEHHVAVAGSAPWEYRWWTMDGPMAALLARAFGFDNERTFYAGPAPEALFEELTRSIGEISRTGEARAAAAAYALLSEAHAGIQAQGQIPLPPQGNGAAPDFAERCVAVIQERWRDPRFGVDQLAAALGLNRSVLSRRFTAALGLPPSEYLRRCRVQNALSQLKAGFRPIQDIAAECGWEDANYFARCIRQVTGMSPQQFRRGAP